VDGDVVAQLAKATGQTRLQCSSSVFDPDVPINFPVKTFKGQSHEKVCEIMTARIGLNQGLPPVFKILKSAV
jgi:hypothetical protein